MVRANIDCSDLTEEVRMANKNKGGRPTVMTKDVFGKLEEAFAVDASVVEAAIYAGVHHDTVYDYINKNPEYSERIEKLRGLTGLRAKINLNTSIKEGNTHDSKWHLERRDPDYKPKSSQDVNIGAHKNLIDAILAKKKCGK